MKKINKEKIENYSGFIVNDETAIKNLKLNHYLILNKNVDGDAPKEFLKIYEFQKGIRKIDYKKKWTSYIAKTGQKWYPAESITEYLLNRIGEKLELNMAQSKLVIINGQIRFLSKFFLEKDERLVHAAEIFSGYLNGDQDFVEQVEEQGLARNFFQFQFVKKSIEYMFKEFAEEILNNFVKLLIFDAIVGNNDRHFFNWGVIINVLGKKKPTFSPIYDTARGLFWNESQDKLDKWIFDKNCTKKILKYAVESRPKTGWNGTEDINHFLLLQLIGQDNGKYRSFIVYLTSDDKKNQILSLIDDEFYCLLPKNRIELIKICINMRIESIKDFIKEDN